MATSALAIHSSIMLIVFNQLVTLAFSRKIHIPTLGLGDPTQSPFSFNKGVSSDFSRPNGGINSSICSSCQDEEQQAVHNTTMAPIPETNFELAGYFTLGFILVCLVYDNLQSVFLTWIIHSEKQLQGVNISNSTKRAVMVIVVCTLIDWLGVTSQLFNQFTGMKERYYFALSNFTASSISIHCSFMLMVFIQLVDLALIKTKKASDEKGSLDIAYTKDEHTNIFQKMCKKAETSITMNFPEPVRRKSVYGTLNSIHWEVKVIQRYTPYMIALQVINLIQLGLTAETFIPTAKKEEYISLCWFLSSWGIVLVNLQVLRIFSVMTSVVSPSGIRVAKLFVILFGLVTIILRIVILISQSPYKTPIHIASDYLGLAFSLFAIVYDNCQTIFLTWLIYSEKVNRGIKDFAVLQSSIVLIIACLLVDWLGLCSYILMWYTPLKQELLHPLANFTACSFAIHSSVMLMVFNQLVNLAFLKKEKQVSFNKDLTSTKPVCNIFSAKTETESFTRPVFVYCPKTVKYSENNYGTINTIDWDV
ncbi:hypothetical protein HDV06_000496 [Boothiomyces sp. JEL0866]|nr:hypothetical protein HDV06_000496 [Boothiomyces sp. JEL0866]